MQIQSIFNTVIQTGLYNPKDCLMCFSLKQAEDMGMISTDELVFALREIKTYLNGFGSLGGFLDKNGGQYGFNTRLDIYLNWASRPFQKEVK